MNTSADNFLTVNSGTEVPLVMVTSGVAQKNVGHEQRITAKQLQTFLGINGTSVSQPPRHNAPGKVSSKPRRIQMGEYFKNK